ncbi:MAG: hypothetical protein MSH49_00765 [[Eubacterium] saphenum]|nr:hypothetical protein [[Eubacterium] saphenum]
MKKLPFNRKITLLTLEPQKGYSEPAEVARATVWANISDVGSTTKFAALQAGQTVSLAVTMWRREFRDYSHAEVDGTRYKIVETGSAKSDLHIKLLLERG